jgi:hypothetical protein
MKFHKVVNLFPPMQQDERTALTNDIRLHGLRSPVIMWQGQVVDGRNRMIAVETILEEDDVQVEIEFVDLDCTEAEMLSHIVSLNMNRRQLSSSQKAAIGAELGIYRTSLGEGSLPDGQRMIDKIAAELGTNRQYLYDAESLMEDDPELFQQVKRGAINLHKAKKLLESGGEEPEKESVDLDDVTDGLDELVPEEWERVFAERDSFKYMIGLFREIKVAAREICDRGYGTAYFDYDMFQSSYSSIESLVKHGMPHALCPYCEGKSSSAPYDDGTLDGIVCDVCKDHGYVNDRIYNMAPDESEGDSDTVTITTLDE